MSAFCYSYEKAFSQLNTDDVNCFARNCFSNCDGTETEVRFSDIERLISRDCWKMAKRLSSITHHTTEEWHDTIVVTLMSNLLPGFDNDDEES